MNVALLPARGGSKRIARKNLRPFHGKPVVVYSIEAARAAGCFDRIIVSTDDDEIAAVAKAHGAEVPFCRPAEYADDHATIADVVGHSISWFREHRIPVQKICVIYATAPFIRPADLLEGHERLVSNRADYCLPVVRFPAPIQRAIRRRSDGRLAMFWPENFSTRSQDLEEAYYDAGQFVWGTAAAFEARKPVFDRGTVPLVLPAWRVVDIDTEEDWEQAERLWPIFAQRAEQ
jgi:N-acylneuraminate cytidylyltransferase